MQPNTFVTPVARMPLTRVPPAVLDRVLDFLPQHDVTSLAQTSYSFYQPCSRKLYRRLTVRLAPVLRSTSRRQNDFVEGCQTVVYGFRKSGLAAKHHCRMLDARLRTLVQSLTVNPELASHIEEVNVTGEIPDDAIEALQMLVAVVESLDQNSGAASAGLKRRLVVKLGAVRRQLTVNYAKWTGLVVDSLAQLAAATTATDITFGSGFDALVDATATVETVQQRLALLDTLIIEDDATQNSLCELLSQKNLTLVPSTVSVVHYHRPSGQKTKQIPVNWSFVRRAQLVVGCDFPECNQECLSEFFCSIPPTAPIAAVAIRQHNTAPHSHTHLFCEKFDVVVFSFLQQFSRLWYVSIRHSPPEDGNLADGLEGNYLRRRTLFTETLPDAIRHVPSGARNLVFAAHPSLMFPNLLHLFACYEQAMNNMLWNGCKCAHCEKTLGLLDEFLMLHQYFNKRLARRKDLTTSQLMAAIATQLSARMAPGGCDLDINRFPLCQTEWDLHQVCEWGPFFCLGHQMYEGAEYDEDEKESPGAVSCRFKQSSVLTLGAIAVSVSHYWENVVRRMIYLNRGDAEDIEIGKADELNDGGNDYGGAPVLGKIVLNGAVFNLGKELNGTNFSQNIYDGK